MSHIEIRDVSLFYDTPSGRVHAVDAVSFDIAASEFLCIVGPSGRGKSTLLNIIAGFIPPTGGESRLDSRPPPSAMFGSSPPPECRERVAGLARPAFQSVQPRSS